MYLLLLLGVCLGMGSSKPAPAASSYSGHIESMTRLLESAPVEHLPAARTLLDQWHLEASDNKSLKGFRQRMKVLQSLRDEILQQLQVTGQDAVSALVDHLWDDARKKTKSKASSATVVPAEQVYRRYLPHFRYSIDTSSLQPAEKTFLQAYYNAEVQATISQVMRKGRALGAGGDRQAQELECYLILLPLLHNPRRFVADSLRELPEWMMTPAHLKSLSDFCLFRAGRLDAAEAIMMNTPGQQPTPKSRYDFYTDAADRCVDAHLPGVAVECLKTVVTLLERNDPRHVELRTRIYEIWAGAQNWALAAGEAGQLAHDFKGSAAAGRAMGQRVKYLSAQGDWATILHEIDDIMKDPQCKSDLPELHYHKWKALRQSGQGQAAGMLLKQFLERYPDNHHGAEMYYVVAVDCLSAQRYDEARAILESIKTRYPQSPLSKKAAPLIEQLSNMASELPAQPASHQTR